MNNEDSFEENPSLNYVFNSQHVRLLHRSFLEFAKTMFKDGDGDFITQQLYKLTP